MDSLIILPSLATPKLIHCIRTLIVITATSFRSCLYRCVPQAHRLHGVFTVLRDSLTTTPCAYVTYMVHLYTRNLGDLQPSYSHWSPPTLPGCVRRSITAFCSPITTLLRSIVARQSYLSGVVHTHLWSSKSESCA